MANTVLLCLGSFVLLFWGIAHLFPTTHVVRGFGDISADNRRIITMEWIAEGIGLVFIGIVVLLSTIIDRTSPVSKAVDWASIAVLLVLAIVSLFTGFKVRFLPFKLCPVIFMTSAVLILLGILI
jgi:hypothetical protein